MNKLKIILLAFIFSSTSTFTQSYLFDGTNGFGTEIAPYRIHSKEHSAEISDSILPIPADNWTKDKYFVLVNSIIDSVEQIIGMANYELDSANRDTAVRAFQGYFDGQNNKINLNIKGFTVKNTFITAMFFTIDRLSYIKNIIIDGYIFSEGSSADAAGISITNYGIIENCINKCYVYADAMGSDYVGGIVAYLHSNVTDCINLGSIELNSSDVGGIVGLSYSESSVISCVNTGEICSGRKNNNAHSYSGAGGIIGTAYNCIINNCINIGNVSGNKIGVAGIVGRLYFESSITNCTNAGFVQGVRRVGGIIGILGPVEENIISFQCTNTGVVIGTGEVGGVVNQ